MNSPIGLMFLLLGLMAVAAMAMCAGTAAGLEYTWPARLAAALARCAVRLIRESRVVYLRAGWLVSDQRARWRRPRPSPQPAPPAIVASVHADVEPFAVPLASAERQVAQLRQELTDAERWPELQPQWRDSTDAFPAYVEATGGF